MKLFSLTLDRFSEQWEDNEKWWKSYMGLLYQTYHTNAEYLYRTPQGAYLYTLHSEGRNSSVYIYVHMYTLCINKYIIIFRKPSNITISSVDG